MMRKITILALLLVQISWNTKGSGEKIENSAMDWYATCAAIDFASIKISCWLDCVLWRYVIIYRKRRRMNERIKQTIMELQKTYATDSDIVRGLGSTLEDYRSRNSIVEWPLRRMDKNCGILMKDIEYKLRETENQYEQFNLLKDEVQQGAVNAPAYTESKLGDLRIKIELATLKKFIDSEVTSLRMSSDIYTSYIAEAIDDVDRVFVAEGF